ncbi:MAG: NADP oxidoreductase, partial [Bacteroidetes bacterium]
LVEVLRFDKSPINDLKEFTGRCDVGFIEGGCCNAENVEVLKSFRAQCDILVAVGECAIMGGIPAMRNAVPLAECLHEAFVAGPTVDPASAGVPGDPDIPAVLDRVYPIPEVVPVDYYLPGCPPPAGHIRALLRHLLLGEPYSVLYADFKYD